ncbi:hypothetical protein SODALDRAFT_346038 [Sodiomyces alkalinus F11]|uniref:DNA replication regulator SLD2 n=1 Tax=Sodiomyces alkalinus (strain CBS 110278 / VKM F-3762 / F11) TaxID=1314773 RepID=A0A3N2PN75_SODAK|nr:hypothetical protein SODALDRAFT_346038 [Sodiomyces alkalinus F11]ROT35796.1 hypothetical protein SODALDRAFT_346038 [Sodiomyces alkalinus F11]
MDDQQKAAFESQSLELRAELKTWESAWAKSHHGRKPGRDDIKRNPDIAQKYKQYNKLRDILSGKVPPPSKHDDQQKKRKSVDLKTQTPSKRQKHLETPSKPRSSPYNPKSTATPSISRTLFSPAAPRSIGPTPQRDGRVLGLFDLMVERELGTPSRGTGVTAICEAPTSQTTPSKRKAAEMEDDDDNDTKPGRRTPMSASKRQLLNSFLTPLKSKDVNARAARTPMSVSKLQFNTPAFLKRHSRAPPDEENGPVPSPPPLRLPRKPLGRGLSAIVASLRKIEEEETHEDDMEALRETEAGEDAPPPRDPGKPPRPASRSEKEDILVADSLVRNLPLGGFDDEAMYDSPEEEAGLGRNGQPLRIFKKKGQKRTTRRSNMKPVFVKRRTAAAGTEHQEAAGGDGDPDEEAVPETQVVRDGVKDDDGVPSDLDDFVPSDGDGEDENEGKPAPKKHAKEGPVKKAARKVNELAHANFRRLKLRNYGAKGGPGQNSRFRRKR